MSVRAIDWVFRQTGIGSSDKFVLAALADNANKDGLAWPATSTIARKTGQDRKTVVAALDRLERAGWIKDTGERAGRTTQIKIYRLRWANELNESSQIRECLPNDCSQKRNWLEGSQIRDGKGSQISGKGSQIRETKGSQKRETEPSGEPIKKPEERTHLPAPDEVISYPEAKVILGRISEVAFKAPLLPNQWHAKWEYQLDKAMPIKRADLELIDWFYRLPENHEIFSLTHKRQSIATLIENLVSEPQKIRTACKAIARNQAPKPKMAAPVEPERTTASHFRAIKELYGPDTPVPYYLKHLAPSVRIEVEEQIAKNKAATRE